MEESEPMALIKAENMEIWKKAYEKAKELAWAWMKEVDEEYEWGNDDDEDEDDDSMDFDPEFEEIPIEHSDDVLVGHEVTDDRWGYLLHESGDIFSFLDENDVPYEVVQTIDKELVKRNPYVLGGDMFYITDGNHAWLHHVGELIE